MLIIMHILIEDDSVYIKRILLSSDLLWFHLSVCKTMVVFLQKGRESVIKIMTSSFHKLRFSIVLSFEWQVNKFFSELL